jgi:hypothetical protein
LTVDEELEALDGAIRKLKIEYDVYFNGGVRKSPVDTEWRVQSLIKKHSDLRGMNAVQRFRYNTIAQRYAVFSDLWRRKLRLKEEGVGRPETPATIAPPPSTPADAPNGARPAQFVVSDPQREAENVRALFEAMTAGRQQSGDGAGTGSFESFQRFVSAKTEQIRHQYGCAAVEYSLEMQDGKVRLKAKAKA